ncbi:HDOD domain-containing protein [Undibacterium sp. Jales W-56]|uniref:HDOD domain-containing protein n=1 Tax=Undibacterium sp. Jales W-56 TaxID=2897325 RepID=UPI0021D19CCF|nr:HDOD domain-containing protein [Undibacterium sp. Jales W-56]MCU6434290.1 HDOD domain-containing protein [Undibacterium sp. Jales W-56]
MSLTNWIKKLFGKEAPAASTKVPRAVNPPVPEAAPVSEQDWQALYLRWLLFDLPVASGIRGPSANLSVLKIRFQQEELLEHLQELGRSKFAGQDLIPRVPAVLPELFKSLRDENTSGKYLADTIAKDIMLVAEVLQEVNSSYYNPASKINNLESAVMLLGQNGLRMLLAKVSFRPVIQVQTGTLTKLLAPVIWEQSELCANAARLFAIEHGQDPFPAFLAGLLQNVGLIVALRVADRSGRQQTLPNDAQFHHRLLNQAHSLSGMIGQYWGFPESVIAAISDQHTDSGEQQRNGLGPVLRDADQLSQICLLQKSGLLKDDDARVNDSLSVSARRCLRALKKRSAAYAPIDF